MKKTVFLGLLTILLTFGFVGCDNGSANGGKNETTTYSVTFDSNGGSNVATITGIETGLTITLPSNPIKIDNDFDGWFIDDGTFQNQFTSSTIITSNLTVFAKWKQHAVPSVLIGTWVKAIETLTFTKNSVSHDYGGSLQSIEILSFSTENNVGSDNIEFPSGYALIMNNLALTSLSVYINSAKDKIICPFIGISTVYEKQ